MWYLTDTCSNHAKLTPTGEIFNSILTKENDNQDQRWDHLSNLCCIKYKIKRTRKNENKNKYKNKMNWKYIWTDTNIS